MASPVIPVLDAIATAVRDLSMQKQLVASVFDATIAGLNDLIATPQPDAATAEQELNTISRELTVIASRTLDLLGPRLFYNVSDALNSMGQKIDAIMHDHTEGNSAQPCDKDFRPISSVLSRYDSGVSLTMAALISQGVFPATENAFDRVVAPGATFVVASPSDIGDRVDDEWAEIFRLLKFGHWVRLDPACCSRRSAENQMFSWLHQSTFTATRLQATATHIAVPARKMGHDRGGKRWKVLTRIGRPVTVLPLGQLRVDAVGPDPSDIDALLQLIDDERVPDAPASFTNQAADENEALGVATSRAAVATRIATMERGLRRGHLAESAAYYAAGGSSAGRTATADEEPYLQLYADGEEASSEQGRPPPGAASQVVAYHHTAQPLAHRRNRKKATNDAARDLLRLESDSRAELGERFSKYACRPQLVIVQFALSMKDHALRERTGNAIIQLGCQLSSETRYDPSATHLLVASTGPESTEKFMAFRAAGKFIVNLNWIFDSIEHGQGRLLCERRYLEPVTAGLPPLNGKVFRGTKMAFFLFHPLRFQAVVEAGGAKPCDIYVSPFPTRELWKANEALALQWVEGLPNDITHVLIDAPFSLDTSTYVADAYVPPQIACLDVRSRLLNPMWARFYNPDKFAFQRVKSNIKFWSGDQFLRDGLGLLTDVELSRSEAIAYPALAEESGAV